MNIFHSAFIYLSVCAVSCLLVCFSQSSIMLESKVCDCTCGWSAGKKEKAAPQIAGKAFESKQQGLVAILLKTMARNSKELKFLCSLNPTSY